MMKTVEIFGGRDDGKLIEVSEDTIRGGVLRRPNFKAIQESLVFGEANPLESPIEHETWLIRKYYNMVEKTFKLKAVEQGMWKRMQG